MMARSGPKTAGGQPRLGRPGTLDAAVGRRLEAFNFRHGQALPLFEALAHSPVALEDLAAGTEAAIERTVLPQRLRELLILRTLARWQARAEWDVHIALYMTTTPLTQEEVKWLGGAPGWIRWTEAERVLIDIADALHERAGIPANLWDALSHAFTRPEIAEILMIVTQYIKVALLTRALELPPLVPNGPGITFPSKDISHER